MHTKPSLATALLVALVSSAPSSAAPPPGAAESVRRGLGGDPSGFAGIEDRLAPLLEKKDLFVLEAKAVSREAARLTGGGLPESAVRWMALEDPAGPLRLLTIDFESMAKPADGAARGYAAYAIVEPANGGPRVSWYHDAGRKIEEQGGRIWHPIGARLLARGSAGAGSRTLLVEEAASAGGAAAGVLVLESSGTGWTASRRLHPGSGFPEARLVGSGEAGVVFVSPREAARGRVLSGGDPGRVLILWERDGGSFVEAPRVAPLPDAVSATEALIGHLRRGETDEARRLAVNPDLIDQMLYFTPGWKGGGRVVRSGPADIEFVYEERGRPTLRLTFQYEPRPAGLLLKAVSGRAE